MRRIAMSQRLRNSPIPPSQARQPIWKVDAETNLIDDRSSIVFNRRFDPAAVSWVIVVQSIDDETPPPLRVGRRDIERIHVGAQRPTLTHSSDGETSECCGENLFAAAASHEAHEEDKCLDHGLLNGLFPVFRSQVTKGWDGVIANLREQTEERGLPDFSTSQSGP